MFKKIIVLASAGGILCSRFESRRQSSDEQSPNIQNPQSPIGKRPENAALMQNV